MECWWAESVRIRRSMARFWIKCGFGQHPIYERAELQGLSDCLGEEAFSHSNSGTHRCQTFNSLRTHLHLRACIGNARQKHYARASGPGCLACQSAVRRAAGARRAGTTQQGPPFGAEGVSSRSTRSPGRASAQPAGRPAGPDAAREG